MLLPIFCIREKKKCLRPLFFLICINDLSDGLTSNPKLFADDTYLFSVVHNINSTANDLNSDLIKIGDWGFQCKMRFDPDPKKQAQEVIFSIKIDHPLLYFNENIVKSSSTHKHLGMMLDTKLDFTLHLTSAQNKGNKTIGLLRKLQDQDLSFESLQQRRWYRKLWCLFKITNN